MSVVAVEENHSASLSISLALITTTPATVERLVVAELPGATVAQPECGLALKRCPLMCSHEDQGPLCQFPVRINGTENFLTRVKFDSSPSGIRVKEMNYVQPETPSCVPLVVFEGGPEAPVDKLVPCLDLTSEERFLYFETLVDSTLKTDDLVSTRYLRIEGDISPVLYGENIKGCSPQHNAFFKMGNKVYVFRIFVDGVAAFHTADSGVEDCPLVAADFQFFEPGYLQFQCSPTDSVLYDPCNSGDVVERLDLTVNASVFQCLEANLNIAHFQGNLTVSLYGTDVEDGHIILPFSDTTTGRCVGGQSPVLFLSRRSGETHFLELSTGKLHFLASDTCGPHSCLELSVLHTASNLFVGVFDYSTNDYLVLNLACPGSPAVSRVHYTSPPARITLLASGSTESCPLCNERELPTTPSSGSATGPNVTSRDDPSITIPDKGRNLATTDRGTFIGIGIGGAFTVVFGVLLVFLAIAALFW